MAIYVMLLVATIGLGLATRRFPSAFPGFVAQFGGDVLWASMVFWLLALSSPRTATRRLALGAFGIALLVECSQLAHVGWLDALRATTAGALVLGQGFLWSDLVCYAVGVVCAAVVDARLVARSVRCPAGADPR